MSTREYELIVWGATGFTGRLVAEYLVQKYGGAADAPRWAMAGRSLSKLEEVRDLIGAPAATPLIVADAADPASLAAMVARADVVITTVGPYQLYGNELVAACVAAGTGYVDLCGEPGWMRDMIDAHEGAATASGARIVFSCGFDSIPFDLGVQQLQKLCTARFGSPAPRIKCRVVSMQGGFSGGTAASLKATMAAAARRPSLIPILTSAFGLTPGFEGASQPNGLIPYWDTTVDAWVAPFIMATINTKNVHRTNFLLGEPYGAAFKYDEMVVTGLGEMGKAAAEALSKLNPFADDKGPKPGEGPSKADRDAGFYELLFVAEMADGRALRMTVKGDRDPGYGSTSRMITEAALCMVRDVEGGGGIWTPGALMGDALVKRLTERAGLSFVEAG